MRRQEFFAQPISNAPTSEGDPQQLPGQQTRITQVTRGQALVQRIEPTPVRRIPASRAPSHCPTECVSVYSQPTGVVFCRCLIRQTNLLQVYVPPRRTLQRDEVRPARNVEVLPFVGHSHAAIPGPSKSQARCRSLHINPHLIPKDRDFIRQDAFSRDQRGCSQSCFVQRVKERPCIRSRRLNEDVQVKRGPRNPLQNSCHSADDNVPNIVPL